MSMVILMILVALFIGVTGGHLHYLRDGAAAERRFWRRSIIMLSLSIVLSIVVFCLVPPAQERLASRVLLFVNLAVGACIGRTPPRTSV